MRHGSWIAVATLVFGLAAASELTGRVFGPQPHDIERYLRSEIAGPIRLRDARLDLLRSQAFVLEDVELRLASWVLYVPRLRVRPDWGALIEGRFEPVAYADSFIVVGAGKDGSEVFARLEELLDETAIPESPVALRGGVVQTRNGEILLHGVELAFQPEGDRIDLALRARQAGAGRLHVVGSYGQDAGDLGVGIFLDSMEIEDLSNWPGGFLSEHGLETADLSGRWHVEIDAAGASRHEISLRSRAGDYSERPLAVELTGTLGLGSRAVVVPGTMKLSGRPFLPGSELRIRAQAERLTSDAVEGGVLVSGPLDAAIRLTGSFEEPELEGTLGFGDARVHVSDWVRKPAGTPATARFESRASDGRRSLDGLLEVGGLTLRFGVGPEGELRGRSGWLSAKTLAALSPNLAGSLAGGWLRIEDAALGTRSEAHVRFLDVELGGRSLPLRVGDISGRARIGSDGFEATALTARLGDTRFEIDLDVSRPPVDETWSVRFAARTREARFAPPDGGETPAAGSEGLPAELLAVATEPIRLIRQEKNRLDGIRLLPSRIVASSVRAGGERIRDLTVEVAFERLELDLRRVEFSRGSRRHHYAGVIDLNPLVPDLRLAAVP